MRKPEPGDRWYCIRDVELIDDSGRGTGEIVYVSGKIYTSELPGCITNEEGNRYHYWEKTDTREFFVKIPKNKRSRYGKD